jgi:uncharacterized Fe-S cluster-containing radical SAM superfamily enzyme
MDRRPRRSIDEVLQQVEAELAALTLIVSELRNQPNTENEPVEPTGPVVGDRVRFHIVGHGYFDGIIVRVTAQRVHIRQDTTNHIFERAPHNVTVLPAI